MRPLYRLHCSMAAPNILDQQFVGIFSRMPPEHQRQGVDILKAKCAEIEGAGSLDAQLALMGRSDTASLPEDERKAMVACGLDQCYWQLTEFLRVKHYALTLPLFASKALTFLVSCSIQLLHGHRRSGTLHWESSCSLRS